MTCPNCGSHLPENAEYCPNCGWLRQNERPERGRSGYAPGAPAGNRSRTSAAPVGVWTYFLWWTVALFSNAEIVCCVLSIVFAFSSSNRNRANFFRAVLLFKLILLIVGAVAVIVLVLSGFSFTALLNQFDFDYIMDFLEGLF